MQIKIMDYRQREKLVEIGDLKDIETIEITVISGDEILEVEYKDDREDLIVDSSNGRFINYIDRWYEIYNEKTGVNLLNDIEFINRKTSYW